MAWCLPDRQSQRSAQCWMPPLRAESLLKPQYSHLQCGHNTPHVDICLKPASEEGQELQQCHLPGHSELHAFAA